MIFCMAAFCAGVIILHWHGVLLPWFYYIFVIALSFVLPGRWKLYFLSLLLGLAYANWSAETQIEKRLPPSWEGKVVTLQGYACSLPVHRERYSRIEFCALEMSFLSDQGVKVKKPGLRRIQLAWNRKEIDWQSYPISLTAKLKRANATANPNVFSYEKYLFYRNIVASGSINSFDSSAALGKLERFSSYHLLVAELTSLRLRIQNELSRHLHHLEHGGLILALLLGDRTMISHSDGEILKATGTQHLLAISGLHVGIVIFLVFRMLPNKNFTSCFVVICTGLAYILLVGFGPSAQRAWVMCSVAVLVASGILQHRLWLGYWLAMFLVVLLDPMAPMSLGFWYSFCAVAILLILSNLKLLSDSFSSLVFAQFLLLFALVPLNNQFLLPQGIGHGLANLIAIPWISVVVLPGSLMSFAAAIFSEDFMVFGFEIMNEILFVLMTFLDSIPSTSDIHVLYRSAELFCFLLLLGGGICFIRIRYYAATLMFIGALFLFLPTVKRDSPSSLWFLDVGQGLSVLVRHHGKVWVYDLGPAYERFSSAETILVPFLKSLRQVDRIDGLIVSHGDNDHAGAIDVAIAVLRPERLWLGEKKRLAQSEGRLCHEGMSWEEQGLEVEVLFPSAGYQADSSNNRSCVVRVTILGWRFLFMGDLEGKGEKYLLQNKSVDLSADVLLAGHHGSNNATSYALLKRVQPDWVVFSSGYRNRFNHPHPKVLERVKNLNARSLITSETGAIQFELAPRLNPKIMRSEGRPFWMN